MTDQPTIVFDLDGTLADTIDDVVSALNRTLAKHQLGAFTSAELAHFTAKGGLRSMLSNAVTVNDREFDNEQLDEMFNATVDDYDQNICVETKLYSGVRASLDSFKSEGWLLAVCTNKPINQTNKLLAELNIDRYFSAVAGADSFEFRKPDPRHLLQTIKLAGGHPDKSVMVGDTITDIQTAQNANIPVIAVDFGYSDIAVEQFAPDRVVSCYESLLAMAKCLIE
jgi:phosphoglycolate phosphatase